MGVVSRRAEYIPHLLIIRSRRVESMLLGGGSHRRTVGLVRRLKRGCGNVQRTFSSRTEVLAERSRESFETAETIGNRRNSLSSLEPSRLAENRKHLKIFD